jgi:rhamnosyltransferase subunit B
MPLRILLAAIGSSGDVNPVVGLGCALRRRGHQVTVATNEIFGPEIRAQGLAFEQLGTRAAAETLMADPRLWNLRKGFGLIAEQAILPQIEPLYRIVERHRGPGCVVAATTLCLGARVAQENLGVPTASIHLQPLVIRSNIDFGVIWHLNMGPRMPRAVKRFLFWIGDKAFADRLVAPGLNAFRATLGMPPVRGIFTSYVHSPQLVLGLFPGWFAPVQPDWPPQTRLTGFILHDDGGDDKALTDADRFLDEGPAPVLVTPGSAAMDRTAFFKKTVEACRRAGVRAMLVTNHPSQLPATLPAGISAFSYLPFSRVLPRCAAIIHHGGIGTLAQSVRAGIPQLVVANAHDQPDNGHRIERLGLGFAASQGSYSVKGALRAIDSLLHAQAIRERCASFAPRVDSAAALEAACIHIEGLAGRG